jgi:hypothetical protein
MPSVKAVGSRAPSVSNGSTAIDRSRRSPSGVEFVGGTQDMPGGSTTYVEARLEPGNYAWIAEVPSPDEKDMLRTFTVE